MTRHRLELELVGNDVVITFQSGTDGTRHTQRITAQDAFNIALVIGDERPEEAINFEISSGVAVQIENRPYELAWITMPMDDGNNLLIQIERQVIDDLGCDLSMMARAGRDPINIASDRMVRSHRVSDFCHESNLGEEGSPEGNVHLL